MKVYIVTEYGGSYDDSWDHIMGVFTDKTKAEEVKDTYWAKVQKRLEEVNGFMNEVEDDIDDWTEEQHIMWDEQYNLQDIAGVKLEEYSLDEFLGGYYNPENAL